MTFDAITLIVQNMLAIYAQQIPVILALAALFTVLSAFKSQAGSPGKVWWRNPGLATDISYALIHTVFGQYFKLPALIVITMLMMGRMAPDEVTAYFEHGRGPFSTLPFWQQAVVYVIGTDFLLYWIHRIFHGATMWRFHAIHHSAHEVDWTTTYRFHPINLMLQPSLVAMIMITLGIQPAVMAYFLPFDIVSAAFVHANVNWTLGPLKFIVATPVFHRWHHTSPDQGGNMNFAPTFSFWDYLFGTFYMPAGKLPEVFGNDDPAFPEGYFAQLIHPFQSKPAESSPPAPQSASAR